MPSIIAYTSTYGSTEQYARDLGRRLGTTPLLFDEKTNILDSLAANPATPIIVLSPVHGPVNQGAKFIVDNCFEKGAQPRRIALCTVGMTLDDVAQAKDGAARALGNHADVVHRFYLPGRLKYSELSPAHRATMWTVVNMLKVKLRKSQNDQMMIDTFDHDVDRVELSKLDQVVAWLEMKID